MCTGDPGVTRIILHGGFHKTATSHIQAVLNRNSGLLARSGVQYIHHRATRRELTNPCQFNAWDRMGVRRRVPMPDAELAALSRAFFAPVLAEAPARALLSDENLLGHCGQCVRHGMLYPLRKAFAQSFAAQLPHPAGEVHVAVRNYADFFAAAYVEFLRAVSPALFIHEHEMKRRVLLRRPDWRAVLATLRRVFSGARLVVWRFEDFPALETRILGNLCGPDVDTARLKSPRNARRRPTASGHAVAELLRLVETEGAEGALARRGALESRYPRGAQHAAYDPWSSTERDTLAADYATHIADIRADPGIELIER